MGIYRYLWVPAGYRYLCVSMGYYPYLEVVIGIYKYASVFMGIHLYIKMIRQLKF